MMGAVSSIRLFLCLHVHTNNCGNINCSLGVMINCGIIDDIMIHDLVKVEVKKRAHESRTVLFTRYEIVEMYPV